MSENDLRVILTVKVEEDLRLWSYADREAHEESFEIQGSPEAVHELTNSDGWGFFFKDLFYSPSFIEIV